jgi:Glycosyl hydrolase family 12/Cellulose binding domain
MAWISSSESRLEIDCHTDSVVSPQSILSTLSLLSIAEPPTTAWTTVVNLGGSSLTNAWNASTTVSGSQLTASNLSYNAAIPTTLTAVWGFQGAGSGRPILTALSVSGGGGSGSGSGGSGGGLPTPPQPSLSGSTCDNFGTIFSSGQVYFVMNNVFNDAMGSQCITANGSGFTVTTANHNVATNGAPASYVAFVRGCHFGTCISGSGLPRVVSGISNVPSSFSVALAATAWDAAYDIWFDHSANTTTRNNGLEMMIWLGSAGVQPIGSQVATATIVGASWQVWYAPGASPPVITYRRASQTTSMSLFDIKAFMTDAMNRSATNGTSPRPAGAAPVLDAAWFLTSVQAGFELWQGGAGAKATSFAAAVN